MALKDFEGSHIGQYLRSQEPMAIGHRPVGQPSSIIQLNDCSIEITFNDLVLSIDQNVS